jgi:hypothetical protein
MIFPSYKMEKNEKMSIFVTFLKKRPTWTSFSSVILSHYIPSRQPITCLSLGGKKGHWLSSPLGAAAPPPAAPPPRHLEDGKLPQSRKVFQGKRLHDRRWPTQRVTDATLSWLVARSSVWTPEQDRKDRVRVPCSGKPTDPASLEEETPAGDGGGEGPKGGCEKRKE